MNSTGDSDDSGMIRLRGVREHNLKNVSLDIPLNEFVVLTGLSGSGKSTLAFDVIFAEGQRRFMECMSAYARQFVEQLPRPEADVIEGLPPTVAIEQRVTRGSAKSTVATVTEVAQYLRLLFAKIGIMHNPRTGTALIAGTFDDVVRRIEERVKRKSETEKTLWLASPVVRNRKGHHGPLATWALEHGFERMRIDGNLVELKDFKPLDRYKEHDIELVVCDLKREKNIVSAVRKALELGKKSCVVLDGAGNALEWFSRERIDPESGESFAELDPKDFSWNSPRGWCPACRGHGRVVESWGREEGALNENELADTVSSVCCPECGGARLNPLSRAVTIQVVSGKKKNGLREYSLPELLAMPPKTLLENLENLSADRRAQAIVARILPEIRSRLQFLDSVGLGYLSLDRASNTLSGGESQRIRLAAQLGSNLSGVLYVLDEPSIGLHPCDNADLIDSLKNLRDRGNGLLVVEHDEDTMRAADRVIDLGPGAGIHGGNVLFAGTPKDLDAADLGKKDSLTLKFLREGIVHPMRGTRRNVKKAPFLEIRNARLRNLKGDDVRFPIGRLCVVCGVSGAGKSTLVSDLLAPALAFAVAEKVKVLSGERVLRERILEDDGGKKAFDSLSGAEHFRKVVVVSQEPIGKTSRSTPATYIGAFDIIRRVFAELPESRMRGHSAGFFSFNTKGGRCEACAGAGSLRLEMNFMPDTTVVCEQCAGTRYSSATEDIRWNGKNIADVLAMTFAEAAEFFSFHKKLQEICALMTECGLGYLTLGQSSPTLSGGESQRLKLVSELVTALPSWKDRMGKSGADGAKKNCYILEEPTIGLHQADCVKLINLVHRLADEGHTVIIVEHHLDVVAEADWLIELGPTGGNDGGRLLYQGAPEGLPKVKNSPTAPYLTHFLKKR